MAEEIRQVAESVAASPEDVPNEYLDTLVRSLERLSRQVESGAVSRSELTEALEHMAEHLTLAGVEEDAFKAQLASISTFDSADQPVQQHYQAEAGPEQNSQVQPEELANLSVPETITDSPPQQSPSQETAASGPENLAVEADSDAPQRRSPVEDDSEAFGHYMGPDPEMVARLEQRRQQLLVEGDDLEGAVPVGAAERSTPGGGDIGGDGEGAAGGAGQGSDVDFAFDDEEIQLPTAGNAEGQRVTVEASPDTVFTDTDGAVQFAFSHWLPSEEAPLEQSVIGLRQQDAVRRYFLPMDPAEQLSDQKGTTQ